MWSPGHISTFWVRNGSLRIKFSSGSVSIITHDCDFGNLLPGNLLIDDNSLLIDFNIFICVDKYFNIKLHYYCFGWNSFILLLFFFFHNIFDMLLFFKCFLLFLSSIVTFFYKKCKYKSSKKKKELFWTLLFLCVCM